MVTVPLVRHADIDLPRTSPEPPLNEAGRARAKHLAHVAGAAAVETVFTSDAARTKQTAAPLAARLGLALWVVPEGESFADDVRANAFGSVVLIVGHTDTLPDLIRAWTTTSISIGENEFDNLFVVTLAAAGATLLRLKYGPLGE